jgi:hypothetical protein
MSGTFPTSPNFRALGFQDNRPTLINQTLSGKRQVRQIGGQYFTFTVSMPPMQQLEAQAIFAFLQKQKGMFETFLIGYPLNNKGVSHSESDILVNGAQSAGDADIASDGFSHTNNALRAGDLIKFANHSKVYMVTDDITASGGAASITISPPLVAAVADNEAITVNKPQFTVYLSTGEISYSTDASGFYSISFEVREVVV